MTDRERTNASLHSLRRLLASVLVVNLLLIALVVWGSHRDDVHAVERDRAACLRGTQDRLDNAAGWRTAEAARRASATAAGPVDGANDLRAAERYDRIASSLEARTRQTLDDRTAYCAQRFPAASLLPF